MSQRRAWKKAFFLSVIHICQNNGHKNGHYIIENGSTLKLSHLEGQKDEKCGSA